MSLFAQIVIFGQSDYLNKELLLSQTFNSKIKLIVNVVKIIFIFSLLITLPIYILSLQTISYLNQIHAVYLIFFIGIATFTMAIDSLIKSILIIEGKRNLYSTILIITQLLFILTVYFLVKFEYNQLISICFVLPSFYFVFFITLLRYKTLGKCLLYLLRTRQRLNFDSLNKVSIQSFTSTILVYFTNFLVPNIINLQYGTSLVVKYYSYAQIFNMISFIPVLMQKYSIKKIGVLHFSESYNELRKIIIKLDFSYILYLTLFFIIAIPLNQYFGFISFITQIQYLYLYGILFFYFLSLPTSLIWLFFGKLSYGIKINIIFLLTNIFCLVIFAVLQLTMFDFVLLAFLFAYSSLYISTLYFKSKIQINYHGTN